MTIGPGSRIGPYEVTALIGEGGMGRVWRAHHTALRRDDALKVLPDAFAADPERLARFQREAQVLASLNHPNIAHVYGLQQSEGVQALVMELVEGPTLADRVAQGAIPADETLPIAKQIAEALEGAHEQGIIHRDLKPANIKLRPDGTVKVLDFGLAKALEPTASLPNLSDSPTITTPAMTQMGVILGTASYMSPEQARGQPVDRRADIWAFGCVLYEMLTGHVAFSGNGVPEILGAVLKNEPDWDHLPVATPVSIQRLLRRALKKDPRQRLGDIRDARIEIEDAATEISVASPSEQSSRTGWVAFAVAAAIGVAVLVGRFSTAPAPRPQEIRLQVATPSTSAPLEFAMSPDGRRIVFVASGDGPQRLWLRPLDKDDAQPIVGTEDADYPFWSPDNQSIGFFARGKLYRIDVGGGTPQFLTNAPQGRGGSWNADGTILFAPYGNQWPISRVAASGGEATAVTRLDTPRQISQLFPQFLPDGRHFLFYSAQDRPEASGIYLGSLDGTEPKHLTFSDTAAAFVRPDWVIFMRQARLLAQRLDATRTALLGDPVTLAESVGFDRMIGGFSVSANGRIAYRPGRARPSRLGWFDRTGNTLSVVDFPEAIGFTSPNLSPDGRLVAVTRTVQNNVDIWLLDLARGGLTRFTFDAGVDNFPLWSPDGKRIAFDSNRTGNVNLYLKPTTGTDNEEVLLQTENPKLPLDWSKDGHFLLYTDNDRTTGLDLWAIEMNGNVRNRHLVINTTFDERNGQFSPDGRRVAYQTNESGRFEIVVQSFPTPAGRWSVSTNGGAQPRWSHNGRELYFLAPDGKLMSASVTSADSLFEVATPVPLFATRIASGGSLNFTSQYAVSRDGRFLILQPVEEAATAPITVILNWAGLGE